jgi:hypothetical protein
MVTHLVNGWTAWPEPAPVYPGPGQVHAATIAPSYPAAAAGLILSSPQYGSRSASERAADRAC